MTKDTQKIGWIGMGRMGFPMAERLLKAGYDVSIWNRTRAKAEPLAAKGGKVADKLADLAGVDVVFSIVSTGKDLDLGLGLGREWDVPMPVTAAAREVLQSHFGAATLKPDHDKYLQKDFAALAETMALAAGMKLESENRNVPSGLES